MLRAAIVGTGLIATQKHLPAWRRMTPAARMIALCDVDLRRGRQVAAQFDIPRVYTDMRELLATEQPDVVDICTPPKTHADIAIQVLESGAHVLVEKPMAISVDECDAMIDTAETANRQICVAHSDLFYPSFVKMREIVRSGAVGEFRGMHISLSTPVHYITSRPDHWANKLPGGVFGETGPHVVYMTLAFINPILQVQAHGAKLLSEFSWSPFEDYRVILVGKHAVSSVALTYATDQWAAEVSVWGSSGRVVADLESQGVIHTKRSALTPQSVGMSTVTAAAQMTTHMLASGLKRASGRMETTHGVLIREFCRSILEGTSPPVTAQEGRESIRVMDSIVQQLT